MRTRLLICTAAGEPLIGLDGAHGDDHATQFIEANLAILRDEGHDPIVIEYDPEEGGDAAIADLRAVGEMRAEIRATPSGSREIVGLHTRRRRGGSVSVARAIRVIHAPATIANPRTTLHRRARGGVA